MQWKKVPHPKLKRDFVGRTVRIRRPMQNAYFSFPVGATVDSRPRTGASLRFSPCSCCGVSGFISGLDDTDFEFVEAVAGGEPSIAYVA